MSETKDNGSRRVHSKLWSEIRFSPTLIAYIVLVVAWVGIALFVQSFRTASHTVQILQQGSILGIAAAGQTIVVLMAGIDLSVSGVMTVSAVVASQLLASTALGSWWSILFALAICVATGLVNGMGVHWLRLHPLIMTLATVTILEGLLLIYTQGTPPTGASPVLNSLVNGKAILGIPSAALVWLAVSVLTYWYLNLSRFGRQIYAVGTNERVAILSGVNIGATKLVGYASSGLFAGVSGLLLFGYVGSTYLTMGTPYQLTTIAAVVLGGTSILGGRGNYLGSIAGVLLLTILLNVLEVLDITQAGRDVVLGLLIILLLLAYGREKATRG